MDKMLKYEGKLLRDTKAYGLSDVQAKNLIKRYKKCKNEL